MRHDDAAEHLRSLLEPESRIWDDGGGRGGGEGGGFSQLLDELLAALPTREVRDGMWEGGVDGAEEEEEEEEEEDLLTSNE